MLLRLTPLQLVDVSGVCSDCDFPVRESKCLRY